MKRYNLLSMIDYHSNYAERSKKDTNLADYIFDNFDKMDEEEMKLTALKCLNLNDCKRILLSHEFYNLQTEPVKELPLSKFLLNVTKILNRYHYKAGGFYFEDSEWLVHTNKSKEYDIDENCVMIENSISVVDFNNPNTEKFIDKLDYLFDNQADNIDVEMKFSDNHEAKIIWVQYWLTDLNQEIDIIPEIEL